jgi:tRNA(fMet)-specific endonuclease VapC
LNVNESTFDTNIILHITRDESQKRILDFVNPTNQDIYISYASIAEVESIAFQNNWGKRKIKCFEDFLDEVQIIEIDDTLLRAYVNIDAFSQRKHQNYSEYSFLTPRNMGKNDLWIASTASLLNLILITTDSDFDHLESYFITLNKILPEQLQSIMTVK